MQVLIQPTKEPKDSPPFVVLRGERVGLRSSGLTAAEEITIKVLGADNVFSAVEDAAGTMTATQTQTSIIASGVYMLSKPETVAPSGASID